MFEILKGVQVALLPAPHSNADARRGAIVRYRNPPMAQDPGLCTHPVSITLSQKLQPVRTRKMGCDCSKQNVPLILFCSTATQDRFLLQRLVNLSLSKWLSESLA